MRTYLQKKLRFLPIANIMATAIAVVLGSGTANATTYTWKNTGNSDLFVASNWIPAGIPSSTDTVVIGAGSVITTSKTASVTIAGATLGAGAKVTCSGTITVNGPLTLNSATFAGKSNMTVSGPLTMTGSTWSAEGNLVANGTATVVNSTLMGRSTFTVNNSFSCTDSQIISGKQIISAKGIYQFLSAGGAGNIINCEFENSGKVVWRSGNLSINKPFRNKGGAIIDVQSSGTLSGKELDSLFDNAGTVIRSNVGTAVIDVPYTNVGAVDVQQGTLEFAQPFNQTDGKCSLNGGTIVAHDGFTVGGGLLDGSGVINGNVNVVGGALKPGHSPGSIVINGNYTQTNNGVLNLEIGGTTPGTGYDQLVINGNAKLAGTLNLIQYGGFTPVSGSNFELMDYYSVAGDFSTINFQYAPNVTFTLTTTPIYLVATAKVASLDATSPTVAIKTPVSNSTYSTLTSATGTAADNVGVKAVTVQLYRYGTATTPAGYWAGGSTWTTTYSDANERPATGTTSWNVTLPTLAPGAYLFRPIAKDAAGNISSSAGAPFLKTNGSSTVALSTAVASSSTSTVQLNFRAPLDSLIALAPARYAVVLSSNGQKLVIQNISYNATTNSVTLTLPAGSVVKGSKLAVTWTNLFDSTGKLLKAATATVTAQ